MHNDQHSEKPLKPANRESEKHYITVIGGLNIDITGRPFGDGIPDNSNPGNITLSLGGVGCNIARNLSRLYSNTKAPLPESQSRLRISLLTTVGEDILSSFALEELKKEPNLDTSNIVSLQKEQCGIYLSVVEGERITAVSDTRVTERITPEMVESWLPTIEKSVFVVADTNLSAQSLNAILNITNKNEIPTLIQGVSVQKNEKLKELKHPFTYLSCNLKEYRSINVNPNEQGNKTGVLTRVTRGIIVTMGADGAKFVPSVHFIHPPIQVPTRKTKVVNPNGAGDAFSAGFIYSITKTPAGKLYLEDALYYGIAAAYITLRSSNTVSDELSSNTLETTVKRIKNS